MIKKTAALILIVAAWCYYGQRYDQLVRTTVLQIPWYVPVLFYMAVCAALLLAVNITQTALGLTGESKAKGILVIVSVFVALSFSELALRATHYLATYSEQRSSYYHSFFLPEEKTWFHTNPPNLDYYLRSPEFKYPRRSNSLGYADNEPVVEKTADEMRIMTMGDSFTEGDGAPFDSSYPQLLCRMLKEKYPKKKFTLINTGMYGSDPYFDYIGLKERCLKYKPDIVLATFCTGDLFDIYYRGSMSRFQPNMKITYNKAPWWEPVFAVSRVSRLFFLKLLRYDGGLVPGRRKEEIFAKEEQDLKSLVKDYNTLAGTNNFKVIVLLKPDKDECKTGQYFNHFETMNEAPKGLGNVAVFDLLQYYLYSKNLKTDSFDKYFWKIDGHHNSDGYHLMAEGAYEAIGPGILTDFMKRTDSTSTKK